MEERARGASGVLAVLGASVIFSLGYPLVKLVDLPAPTIAVWRVAIGAVALVGAALALRLPWPESYVAPVLAGIGFGLHQLLYIGATLETSIAIVTIVGSLQPLAVAVVSRRAVGERVPRTFALWAILALVGVGMVVAGSYRDESRSLYGDLLSLANVVVYTGYFLFAKRARQEGAHTVTLTAVALLVALVVVLPALAWAPTRIPSAGADWFFISLLALGPGNGHLLLNWAHSRVTAALASLILAGMPLLAGLWAHLIFGEPFGPLHIAGMVVVTVAIEGGRRAERSLT